MLAASLAVEADFFSVGTNDLTQYALAIDRGHPELSAQADGLHPAVLRLIQMTVEAAHAQGKWVGVCGELASDAMAVPVLVGLGVDELSVSARQVPMVKARLREFDLASAQEQARRALSRATADEVRDAWRRHDAAVLVLSLNPALDLSVDLERLSPGRVNRTRATHLEAAGKGVNVARVLVALGHEVAVSGFLGADNDGAFRRTFETLGIEDACLRVPGETRTNVKLAEDDGRVTDINGPGVTIDANAWQRLIDELERRLAASRHRPGRS